MLISTNDDNYTDDAPPFTNLIFMKFFTKVHFECAPYTDFYSSTTYQLVFITVDPIKL